MTEPSNDANLIADAVRVTFDCMSATDRKAIQTAVLRAQRKALAKQMREVKAKEQA